MEISDIKTRSMSNPYHCTTLSLTVLTKRRGNNMNGVFVVIGISLGLSSMVESIIRVSGGAIDKLIEKKMESVMKTYDRKIALLEDKIYSHERKSIRRGKKIKLLKKNVLVS